MSTPYDAVSRGLRSGGKIVRARRPGLTPYSRPPADASPVSVDHTPGWLSWLLLSPSRLIATGAGKLLASVFGSDSESSSDSEYTGSEEDVDDFDGEDCHDLTPDVRDSAVQNRASQETNSLINDYQVFEWRTETMRVIGQLLMEETFSREESDRLAQIIESRVSNTPVIEVVGSDFGMSDLGEKAVIEAKKWLEKKNSGPDSKSDVDYGICSLNTFVLQNVDECEMGSPVDLAKSYMQARPPWSSPSVNQIQYSSQILNVQQHINEKSPYPYSGNTSQLHKESPLSGSWSILEELRKVRSGATEDLLKTRPASKIDQSSLDSRFHEMNGSVLSEASERHADVAKNGFPSGFSLPAEERRKEKSRPFEENGNEIGSDHKLKTSVPEQETCNFSIEHLLDVPVMDLNNDEASMSHNSFSTLQDEIVSGDQPRSKFKSDWAGRVGHMDVNQRGKKVSRYKRRGRGRGK